MRNATTAARLVLGGYLAAHGAQKLFGVLGGHGLAATGQGFASMGLTPGREMAALAGASELGGGVLTALGAAEPLGPIAIAGTMAVATVVHRKAGPFSTNGGFELPLTNLALTGLVAAVGSSGRRLGPPLPTKVAVAVAVGAAALTATSVAKVLKGPKPAADTPAGDGAGA